MECENSAYIWREEVLYSIRRAFEGQSSDEEDGEDHVRQSRRDVHGLRKMREMNT